MQEPWERFNPWVEEIPWGRKWQPTPVFLPDKSHGQRNLAGYSPWGHKESDKTKQLSKHAPTSVEGTQVKVISLPLMPNLVSISFETLWEVSKTIWK